jgi:hypothetical protein
MFMHVVPSCTNASESQIAALGFLAMTVYVPQFLVYDVMAPMIAMMEVMKQIVVTILMLDINCQEPTNLDR